MGSNATESRFVDAMLAAARIVPDPGEREALIAGYAAYRPGVEALHAVPRCRYEHPALNFEAAPRQPHPWGGA